MDVGPARQPRSPLVFQVGAEPHFPCLERFPTDGLKAPSLTSLCNTPPISIKCVSVHPFSDP